MPGRAAGGSRSAIARLPPVLRAARLLAVVQQPDDGRRRLLDGAARHVDDGPAVLARTAGASRSARWRSGCGRRIRRGCGRPACCTRLRRISAMRSGLATSPTTKARCGSASADRRLDAGHQRQIRGLVAALGEIDAGGRLGRARDAEDDDVGRVQVLRQLAVVVRHGEIQRIDAPEIVGIDGVLAGHHRRLGSAQIGLRTPA